MNAPSAALQALLFLLDNPGSQVAAVIGIVAFLRQFIELIPDARPSSPRSNAYLQVATVLVSIILLFVVTAAAGRWTWDAQYIILLVIQALMQCGGANLGYAFVKNQKAASDIAKSNQEQAAATDAGDVPPDAGSDPVLAGLATVATPIPASASTK